MRSVRQLLSRPLTKVAPKQFLSMSMEETNNWLISFKTFDQWVKARTAKCDMALKDALSFISEKTSSLDGEKDSSGARPASTVRSNPSHTEPGSWWTYSTSDPQLHREISMDRGETSIECRRGEITMEPKRTPPTSFQDHWVWQMVQVKIQKQINHWK